MNKYLALVVAASLSFPGFAQASEADTVAYQTASNRVQAEEHAPVQKTAKSNDAGNEIMYKVVEGGDFKVAELRPDHLIDMYRLAKYDTIKVMAMGFPNGFGVDTLQVGPDGFVQLPYVGNVKLAGCTLDEAGAIIRDALSPYLKIPQLSVYMAGYGARKVYVMGEVASPGIKDMGIDNMNAYAAVGAAGGITKHGRERRVQVLRTVGTTMYYQTVDLGHYIKNHDLTQNLALEDGDIVYVPKSNKVIFGEDVMPYISMYGLWRSLTN